MNSLILTHEHNGVVYYEVDGVYFYVEPGLFNDISVIQKNWPDIASRMKHFTLYIFKSYTNNELMCDFNTRTDCNYEHIVDGNIIKYNSKSIDFTDKNVLGFVKLCIRERRNYNVVCYLNEGIGGDDYFVREDLTLSDFFECYCHK